MEFTFDFYLPLWSVIVMSVAAYLLIGVLTGRKIFRASRTWGSEDAKANGMFLAGFAVVAWPLMLPISLVFWRNKEE